jgi:hypothetical protein
MLALGEHYTRAEIEADVVADGSILVRVTRNINAFAIRPPVAAKEGASLKIGEQVLRPPPRTNDAASELYLTRRGDRWELSTKPIILPGKRPGMQGPIDDAFTAPSSAFAARAKRGIRRCKLGRMRV